MFLARPRAQTGLFRRRGPRGGGPRGHRAARFQRSEVYVKGCDFIRNPRAMAARFLADLAGHILDIVVCL